MVSDTFSYNLRDKNKQQQQQQQTPKKQKTVYALRLSCYPCCAIVEIVGCFPSKN